MNDIKQDKFPLSYAVLKDLYHTQMPEQVVKGKYWWESDTKIDATIVQRNHNFYDATQEVNEPIWSLCEDILLGKCEINLEKDKVTLTMEGSGAVLTEQTCYHMFVSTHVSPNVTENITEETLLTSVIKQVAEYERNGKYRDQLLEFYEESGCERTSIQKKAEG